MPGRGAGFVITGQGWCHLLLGQSSKRQIHVKNPKKERKGGCRQSLGSFPPYQAPGRFFRRD